MASKIGDAGEECGMDIAEALIPFYKAPDSALFVLADRARIRDGRRADSVYRAAEEEEGVGVLDDGVMGEDLAVVDCGDGGEGDGD